jgi:citrate synthase
LAHWVEALQDPAGMKIYRPRQVREADRNIWHV